MSAGAQDIGRVYAEDVYQEGGTSTGKVQQEVILGYGTLKVDCNVKGADVCVDGRYKGQTPVLLEGVAAGKRSVSVILPGYRGDEKTVEIVPDRQTSVSLNMVRVATVYVESDPSPANLYINDQRVGTTPYEEEVEAGRYDFVAKLDGYKDEELSLDIEEDYDIFLKLEERKYMNQKGYWDLTFGLGGPWGMGTSLGVYFSRFNVEAEVGIGLKKSDTIYWTADDPITYPDPTACVYKPVYFNVKFGYGIQTGYRVRLTPQLGLGVLGLKERIVEQGNVAMDHVSLSAFQMTLDLRCDFAVSETFAFVLRPAFKTVPKSGGSDAFQQVRYASDRVSKFCTGFTLQAGIAVLF